MNLYEYQRSRSFTDLGPNSFRFNILFFFSLETAKLIEDEFHLYPPWVEVVPIIVAAILER